MMACIDCQFYNKKYKWKKYRGFCEHTHRCLFPTVNPKTYECIFYPDGIVHNKQLKEGENDD